MKSTMFKSIDITCVNTIRALSIDMIQKANSGHPGLPLGAAPMAYVLWNYFLRYNPKNPDWYNRDRFVLSAGHGSALLYSLLHLAGYQVSLEQLQQFRQWGSITPGHPEYGLTPGVEITTGPLGQGFANGVGMAIAEANLAARYNDADHKLIDHYTYGIVSDGDLMEGVAAEAASLAGHLHLGKLIYLYDDNHITLASSTQLAFTEDRAARFAAYGWHTQVIEDGNDLDAIHQAILAAQQETECPSLILVKTIIGYGSPHKEGTFAVHGSPLGVEEVKLTKQRLNWPEEPLFYIPEEVKQHFAKTAVEGAQLETRWDAVLKNYQGKHPEQANELQQLMQGELPPHWDENIQQFPSDAKGMATRVASGKVMQDINPNLPGFIGGSADLNPSTHTALINFGNLEAPKTKIGDLQGELDGGWDYSGRNLFYGVREHAMGAIANGIATFKGMLPFTATFFTFSDYMRPTLRLAALMHLKVIFIFTHDSIGLGEDGPTHQPVEQLASLRAIPGLIVIRPADANETAAAWRVTIAKPNCPIALVLSRQAVPTLDRNKYPSADGLQKGAYILVDAENGKPDIILLASGAEVDLIIAAQQKLLQQNIAARVVSMPSWELFAEQPQEYRDRVLPPSISKRLAVEAGCSQGWWYYLGDHGDIISIEKFGASAPGPIVMKEYGFTVDNVCERALALLNKDK